MPALRAGLAVVAATAAAHGVGVAAPPREQEDGGNARGRDRPVVALED